MHACRIARPVGFIVWWPILLTMESAMNAPALTVISPDDTFQFACRPAVPCFNHCCRDLNQALTPYDVLRMRTHLGISWEAFIERFAGVHAGPATGLPVVSLRFDATGDRRCPFVAEQGCRVYDARPTSCRLYPLARALRRRPTDGRISVHYALLQEPHCRGFEQAHKQTVRQWIAAQNVEEGLAADDALMGVIALKNSSRPGPLPAGQLQWVQMALYDLERFKFNLAAGNLNAMDGLAPLPDMEDDAAWLAWGLAWVQRLFSRRTTFS
jgi:uncharacterized protein